LYIRIFEYTNIPKERKFSKLIKLPKLLKLPKLKETERPWKRPKPEETWLLSPPPLNFLFFFYFLFLRNQEPGRKESSEEKERGVRHPVPWPLIQEEKKAKRDPGQETKRSRELGKETKRAGPRELDTWLLVARKLGPREKKGKRTIKKLHSGLNNRKYI